MIQQILGRSCPRQDSGDQGSPRWYRGGCLRMVLLGPVTPTGATTRRALHGATRCTSGLVQAVLVVLLIARCGKKGERGVRNARWCNIRLIRSSRKSRTPLLLATFFLWPAGSPGEMCVTFAERIYTSISAAIYSARGAE